MAKTKQQQKCYRCSNKIETKQVNSMQPTNICNQCYNNSYVDKPGIYRPKNLTKEEFDRYIRPCGSSGHIGVSKAWVGKWVHVTMEEVKDD